METTPNRLKRVYSARLDDKSAKKAKYLLSSSESSTDDSESIVTPFVDNFFGNEMPYLFDAKKDAFLLDVRAMPPIKKPSDEHYDIRLFCRDLRSYPNDSVVSKHCAPWGEFGIFSQPNQFFVVEKKFFISNGQVESILLSSVSEPTNQLLVKFQFFEGWADQAALRAYKNYQ